MYAEKAGHFPHPPANDGGGQPQALEAEGQLVPDLIGDDLVFGVLHNEPDFGGGLAVGKLLQRHAAVPDLPRFLPVGRKLTLQKPQEGGLPAARFPAQHHEFAGVYGEGNAVQRRGIRTGVGKAHIFERKYFHVTASLISMKNGRNMSRNKRK